MSPDERNLQGGATDMPQPTLVSLAHMIFLQGMIAAGKVPSPVSNKYESDPAMAKFHVELLDLLQEKTTGNRTAEEDEAFGEMLHQLRLAYMDVNQKK